MRKYKNGGKSANLLKEVKFISSKIKKKMNETCKDVAIILNKWRYNKDGSLTR